MGEKKIVHIVLDAKFVSQIEKFRSPGIKNKLIYWGTEGQLPEAYSREALHVYPEKKNFPLVVKECIDADLVIMNSLLPSLAVKIPKNIKLAWYFFGFELYERFLSKVLSEKTFILYHKQKGLNADSIKKIILFFFPNLSDFNRALKRVNYFMGYFEEEYLLLKSWGVSLPPFIRIPVRPADHNFSFNEKKKVLLLGNSRTFFNNHLDVISILQETGINTKLKIKLFFNYGEESLYTKVIREEALKIPDTEFIDQFLSKAEFEKIYRESAALIINSYRQMALGNIFMALKTGTKIYLSQRNVTLDWLRTKEFKIFSIENDFVTDLKQGTFYLSDEDALHNFETFRELSKEYTIGDFQRQIFRIIESR